MYLHRYPTHQSHRELIAFSVCFRNQKAPLKITTRVVVRATEKKKDFVRSLRIPCLDRTSWPYLDLLLANLLLPPNLAKKWP